MLECFEKPLGVKSEIIKTNYYYYFYYVCSFEQGFKMTHSRLIFDLVVNDVPQTIQWLTNSIVCNITRCKQRFMCLMDK